jgi:hypothetical protein
VALFCKCSFHDKNKTANPHSTEIDNSFYKIINRISKLSKANYMAIVEKYLYIFI